jgi:hypothetical protein
MNWTFLSYSEAEDKSGSYIEVDGTRTYDALLEVRELSWGA